MKRRAGLIWKCPVKECGGHGRLVSSKKKARIGARNHVKDFHVDLIGKIEPMIFEVTYGYDDVG